MTEDPTPFVVTTPRLILRPLDPLTDLAALHRIGGDARVAQMMQSTKAGWTMEEASGFLDRALWRGRLGFRLAIALRPSPQILIGTVGIGGVPASTAYFLDPEYWGRGLVTEAMGAFLAAAMDHFGLGTVTAGHFADNPASGAVLTKLGFVQEGEERGGNAARLEPERILLYRLDRAHLKAASHEVP